MKDTAIRFIGLQKDEQLDEMHCATCGRLIRKAIEINKQTYGLDCGANLLGWRETKKAQIEKRALRIFNATEYFKAIYEKGNDEMRMMIAGGALAGLLNVTIRKEQSEYDRLYAMVAQQEVAQCLPS